MTRAGVGEALGVSDRQVSAISIDVMDEAITGRGATRAKDLFASLDDEGDADETGAVRSADRARV